MTSTLSVQDHDGENLAAKGGLWIASKVTAWLHAPNCKGNLTGLGDGDGSESVVDSDPESELQDEALLS